MHTHEDTPCRTPILLHQSQETLRELEARYHRLVAHMSAIVFELDPDGTVIFTNEGVTSILGYHPDELQGKNWWDLLFPGDQRRQVEELAKQLRSGDVYCYELGVTTKDGARIVLELDTANRYRTDGTLQRIVGFAVDSTRRKRAEAALRRTYDELEQRVQERTAELAKANQALQDEIAGRKQAEEMLRVSEDRFRVALRNSPITVATLDRDLRYTWVYNTRHGFKPEQVLGKRPDELLPPEEVVGLTALLQRVLETGNAERGEVSGHTRGELWVYDVTGEPLRDQVGRVIGLTIANIDVTQRKRMEEELRRARNELEMRVQERTKELAASNEQLRIQVAERARKTRFVRMRRARQPWYKLPLVSTITLIWLQS